MKTELIGVFFIVIGLLPHYEKFAYGKGYESFPNTSHCNKTDITCPSCFSSSSDTCHATRYLKTTLTYVKSGGNEDMKEQITLPCYNYAEYRAGTGAWGYSCNPTGGCVKLGGIRDPNAWINWCYPSVVSVDFVCDAYSMETKPLGEG